MTQNQPSLDIYVKYSRRCIQLSLIFIFILSTIALLNFTSLDSINALPKLMALLPIFIIFAIVWLQSFKKKNGLSNGSEAFKAMFADELRHQSIDKAYRSAFFVTIVAQIPLSLLLNASALTHTVLILGATTLVLGISVFLTFFLYYDK